MDCGQPIEHTPGGTMSIAMLQAEPKQSVALLLGTNERPTKVFLEFQNSGPRKTCMTLQKFRKPGSQKTHGGSLRGFGNLVPRRPPGLPGAAAKLPLELLIPMLHVQFSINNHRSSSF